MKNKYTVFRHQLIKAMVQAGFTKKYPAGWFAGKNIEEILKEKVLDQVRLADELQYDRATVNHWLHGKKSPSIDSLAGLSKVLGVSSDFLLGIGEQYKENHNNFLIPALHDNETQVMERQTTGEVWLVSPNLKNDVDDGSAVETVKFNIQRRIKYTYILRKNDLIIDDKIEKLKLIFSGNEDLLTIIRLSDPLFDIISRTHLLILNPKFEKGSKPIVYMELPLDKDLWIRVAEGHADALRATVRKIIDSRTDIIFGS